MADSSHIRSSAKAQPSSRKDFPLWVHKGTQRWCKKIKQRLHYFGTVADDPKGEAALRKYLDQRDDLLAGRVPKAKSDEVTLGDLCNHYLTFKKGLVASGELSQRTFDKYKDGTDRLVETIGTMRTASDIGPDDFLKVREKLAKRYGPVSLANHIQTIRSVFKHGYDVGLLDRPTRFGKFQKPRAKVMREVRLAKGDQDFTAHEVRQLLKHATPNMRAMILLAVQGGFGGADCAHLELSAVDLVYGWIDWPRTKTATHRRFALWPETIAAIKAAVDSRPYESPLVFIGRRGENYITENGGYRVAQEFKRVAAKAGVRGKSFYCGRRTFQTVGEDCRDLVAVQAIMGHIPSESNMSARYRQRISDDRLKAVTDAIHSWLWPRPTVGNGGAA